MTKIHALVSCLLGGVFSFPARAVLTQGQEQAKASCFPNHFESPYHQIRSVLSQYRFSPQGKPSSKNYEITWKRGSEHSLTLMQKAVRGMEVEVFRCHPDNTYISLGRGRVQGHNGGTIRAYVSRYFAESASGTMSSLNASRGDQYLRPMEGDWVRYIVPKITVSQAILETHKYPVDYLFTPPVARQKLSYKLTEKAKNSILEKLQMFKGTDARVRLEAFRYCLGERPKKAIEITTIRAGIIKNWILMQPGFEKLRITSLGLGQLGHRPGMLPKRYPSNRHDAVEEFVKLRLPTQRPDSFMTSKGGDAL